MMDEDNNMGLDPLEFISWINESWNNESMDDIVSSGDEWEESDYGNPPNTYTNTESLFKPYFGAHEKSGIGNEDK
ncbi:hypothetical protein Tco_0292023 [Tanacetum coccineum]